MLQLRNIQSFALDTSIIPNEPYVRALRLWSALFSWHFVSMLLRKKKGQQRPDKLLLAMIRTYKENNGFGCDAQHGHNNKVALYAQQMFYRVLRKVIRKLH